MDYEKKYKALVEAVKILKEANPSDEGIQDWINDSVPELQESEDERIRRELVAFLKETIEYGGMSPDIWTMDNAKKWLAWIEKQDEQKSYGQREECLHCQFNYAEECKGSCAMKRDEQKPADKAEPKFKVGDWVVRGKTIAQILDIQEQYYVGLDIDGNDFTSSRFLSDNKIHLWDITKDAKPGDVLANDHHILILKELGYTWASNGKPECLYAYCGIKPDGNFELEKEHYCFCGILRTHPATKEQRDTLKRVMTNAGYRWNKEELKLEKI